VTAELFDQIAANRAAGETLRAQVDMEFLLFEYQDATATAAELKTAYERQSDRRARALFLMHEAGLTYDKIAKLVGLSTPRVGQLVSRATPTPKGTE
jgi:DNA-directed RNA polymerase specialized sigma24 family protein